MKPPSVLRLLATWGPGLLVMLADTDAGNVVTAAQAGAQWGYRLLPLVLLLTIPLYLVQELTVRLGVCTGRGYAELVAAHFGRRLAWLSAAGLAVATVGTLVTEFTAVAGIGELYDLPRAVTLPAAVVFLLAILATGSGRRVERLALLVGLFELAFFVVAWKAHPGLKRMAEDAADLRLGDPGFMYLVAATIGSVFNPWMIFYQQSAIVEKAMTPAALSGARWDTGIGAVLTQCLTGAVLVAAAGVLRSGGTPGSLSTVGGISDALSAVLGQQAGRLIFSAGVLGASLVAAIVSSLALAWGAGELAGYKHSLETRPLQARWFYGIYALAVAGAAALVWLVPDLVWLNIAAQVLNAFLMPLTVGLLVALAVSALPTPYRPRGWYLRLLIGITGLVTIVGVAGGIAGFFGP